MRIAPWVLVELVRTLQRFAVVAARAGLAEFEINPLALTPRGPVALDALGRLAGPAPEPAPARPLDKLDRLLKRRSVAVVGVSERPNPGRVILENLLREGFPPEHIVVAQLVEQFIPLLREHDLLEQDVLRIEPDEQWPRLRRELERLLPLADPHLAGRTPRGSDDGHGDGNAEDGNAAAEVLKKVPVEALVRTGQRRYEIEHWGRRSVYEDFA